MNEELNAQKKIEKVVDYLAEKFMEFNVDDVKKFSSESFVSAYNEIFIEGKEIGLDYLRERTEEEQEETKRKIVEGFEKRGFKVDIKLTDDNSYLADFKPGFIDKIIKDGFLS